MLKNTFVIFLGDFNAAHNAIDTHKPDPNHPSYTPEERSGFSKLLNLGFIDAFRFFNKSKV